MSADIEKLAVFDSRIVQSRPKYAVEKGALSLTNAPFNAISATASQHTYNIYVPSENVFVDRALEWSAGVNMTFNAQYATLPAAGGHIANAGVDWSLCAFPLNSMCSTTSATINDTTAVINTNDVLREVLRLTDYKANRLQRTCPAMLDKYQSYNDGAAAVNNTISGYQNMTEYAETPNGAWGGIIYTTNTGQPLSTTSTYLGAQNSTPAFAGAAYCNLATIPVAPPVWTTSAYAGAGIIVQSGNVVYLSTQASTNQSPPNATYWTQVTPRGNITIPSAANGPAYTQTSTTVPVYFQFTSTEKCVLSPFTFADIHEWDTGLFGINNIQLIMNLQTPSRLVRSLSVTNSCSITDVNFNLGAIPGVFQAPRINVQFLTPSLDVPLPPKSVVPYMEFPRYITSFTPASAVQPGSTVQITSQTITLPQIPDLFIIYVKPLQYYPGDADYYFPIAGFADNVNNPLTINFDNFSGLLSSQTAQQLYGMSVKNGLDMDFNAWSGQANGSSNVYNGNGSTGLQGRIPTVGGFLVLKPSQDITLQTGQAPSLVGNFTFQFNLTVKNTTPQPVSSFQMFVITANSGFFESIRGSSRIIKGVLSEQDIISAPLAPQGTRDVLHRYVGGAGMIRSMANVMSKAKDIYHATKPVVAVARMASGAGDVEQSGGRRGTRKGLEARLM